MLDNLYSSHAQYNDHIQWNRMGGYYQSQQYGYGARIWRHTGTRLQGSTGQLPSFP